MDPRGQQMVPSYPTTSRAKTPTLMTLYRYCRGHHSNSYVTKIGKNCWKTCFFYFLPPFYSWICFLGQQLVSIHTMRSPMVPFTLTIPSSYLMGHYNYPFMTKNGTKSRKTDFLTSASISLPYTQTVYYGPKNNVQPSHDITHNAPHPHDPT